MQVWSLGQEDSLEEEMATHFNILAWKIPWTEESGGTQSMGSQRVWHDWATEHSTLAPQKILSTTKRKEQRKMFSMQIKQSIVINYWWHLQFFTSQNKIFQLIFIIFFPTTVSNKMVTAFALRTFWKLNKDWSGKYIVFFSEIIYFFGSFAVDEDMRNYFSCRLYGMWNFYQMVVIKHC